ncbi:hypothetical protein [Novosphingobium resinovorum]|uniref:hypothetical protein n=1 Tax=Novosphingobium resinovorum TaxID=158500 RepID=UPI002ED092A7|nr:hypothetical protein [Novosphingobium resinovorum]
MKRSVLSALGLAGVLVLAGCLETMPGPDRPHRPPPPRDKPAMCTREYAPVCGVKRKQRQTFSNACMAKAEGFRVVASGDCRR